MSKYRKADLQRFADIFKALSNPNRLRIFLRLISCCKPGTVHRIDADTTVCVGELGKELDIVPSTVSHHIKELYRSGIIKMNRRGQKIECWIDPEIVKDLANFFRS
ncbi:MAG: metalloregulator ArsR/SmtB family transcription factor [Nitrospirota bacterium]|nr:metalloregulator ArsR/SmtB family transcription factor [Nitrospirota bacterium]MDH5768044.1 metalloregulator ArsR/SmtB family transcription factor [Nitrospirota bacterium]